MGFFDQFPYTNFHDLNLDWMIEKIKELEARVAALEGSEETEESE